jgi:outer membrane biosynthesis protein TonB
VKREAHFVGVAVTVLLHGAMLALFVLREDGGCLGMGGTADAAAQFQNAQTIEASLAFLEVKPQSKQPQKQKRQTYRPDDGPTIHNPDAPAPPDTPDHKLKVRPDEVDINSVLEKHRVQDPDLSSTGADEIPKEGSASGSQWGTEKDAKGIPYAGELKGRIYSVWQLPSLETGTGEAEGCVKLDKKGKIVERHIRKKSGNANLDRSVELALKQAPDMEDPVPDEHLDLFTEQGICFRFTP